jgi:hypothetical protein
MQVLGRASSSDRLGGIGLSRDHLRPPAMERPLESFIDQFCLAVPVAETNARQESLRVIGPQARDVADPARHSIQHTHLRVGSSNRSRRTPTPSHRQPTFRDYSAAFESHAETPTRDAAALSATPASEGASILEHAPMTRRELVIA